MNIVPIQFDTPFFVPFLRIFHSVNHIFHSIPLYSRMHENLRLEASLDDYQALQVSIMDLAKMRMDISGDSTLKVHKDSGFTENPLERSDVLESVKVISLFIPRYRLFPPCNYCHS